MSKKAKTLIEKAHALPAEDRILLVENVLDSLDHADASIDRLWAKEAADRADAYRRGEVTAKELNEVLAKHAR